ncbi:hypothetical protein D3C80_1578390 [compost metagenome]
MNEEGNVRANERRDAGVDQAGAAGRCFGAGRAAAGTLYLLVQIFNQSYYGSLAGGRACPGYHGALHGEDRYLQRILIVFLLADHDCYPVIY